MERKKFTKEDKRKYREELRLDWKRSKALAENDMTTEALYRESGLSGVSYLSFHFVLKQMNKLKLEGLPYIDCKTFQGWKENGFKVKKGEHSKLRGITWMVVKKDKSILEKFSKKEDDIKCMYPKVYNLFHKSQVEKLK